LGVASCCSNSLIWLQFFWSNWLFQTSCSNELVKLTFVANLRCVLALLGDFTEILGHIRSQFHKHFTRAFFVWKQKKQLFSNYVWLCDIWRQNFVQKHVHKTLMKLTVGNKSTLPVKCLTKVSKCPLNTLFRQQNLTTRP